MKYLFGTDASKHRTESPKPWEKLLRAELPDTLEEQLSQRETAVEKASRCLPPALSVIKWICLIAGAICGIGVLRSKVGFVEGYRNAPYFYWIAGVGLCVGGLLSLVEKLRRNQVAESDARNAAMRDYQAALRSADAYLGIPEKAKKFDILSFRYQVQGENLIFKGPAYNLELRLFMRDGMLCLSDGLQLFAIEQRKLTGIRLIEQSLAMDGWNKEEDPTHQKFRQAGLVLRKDAPTGLKYCCALEWTMDGEQCALLFPCYELQRMEALTGLRGPKLPDEKTPVRRRNNGKVRPVFYWTVPKEENVAYWFTPMSDEAFKLAHPKLYILLVCIGLLVLFLPWFGFPFLEFALIPGATHNAWVLLGMGGGLLMGIGFFNIVGAWLGQYLGHWVTIVCIVLGAVMMGASWLLLI